MACLSMFEDVVHGLMRYAKKLDRNILILYAESSRIFAAAGNLALGAGSQLAQRKGQATPQTASG